ncbi:hypothetical protein ACS0TY_028216 [Phlomoides rotata]
MQTVQTYAQAMENACDDKYTCPSFNSYYSSDKLREISTKLPAEKYDDDEDFEFSLVREDNNEFSGEIESFFPLFNRDLLRSNDGGIEIGGNEQLGTRIDVPLVKLLLRDREDDFAVDELENVPAGTCCVWRPNAAGQASPSRCKKSRSAGSGSKQWKLRDLLRRSNSEGKDSFVFLAPRNREEKIAVEVSKKGKGKEAAAAGAGPKAAARSPHETMYVRNRMIKEGDKKKSYLPYRRDLLGFFQQHQFIH